MNRSLYLAGKMNDLTYEEASGWRMYIQKELKNYNVNVLSPMRNEDFSNIGNDVITDKNFTNEYKKEIFMKDVTDIMNCDDVVINFMNEQPSFGSNWEMGYSYFANKIIYAINVPDYLQKHPFFIASVNYCFNDINKFINFYIKNIL